jgi:hypothetical protein
MMAAMSRLYIERNAHPNMQTHAVLKKQYADVVKGRDSRVSL